MANTVSGYADKFVQKFGLNLQSTLTTALRKIKHTKNRQISQAFSHTYLVGAVIVLILSPIALLTDRKPLKS
ncbi:MFS transporter [Lactobacillus crispatus]|nr:MFS transporter [Lactobacillus crispatus]